MELKFRFFNEDDWGKISEIYKQGIETKNATFQLEIPNWIDWNNNHLANCRIVAELNNNS